MGGDRVEATPPGQPLNVCGWGCGVSPQTLGGMRDRVSAGLEMLPRAWPPLPRDL